MKKRRVVRTILNLFNRKVLEGSLSEREFAQLIGSLKEIDKVLANKEKKKVAKEVGRIVEVLVKRRQALS